MDEQRTDQQHTNQQRTGQQHTGQQRTDERRQYRWSFVMSAIALGATLAFTDGSGVLTPLTLLRAMAVLLV